ncbi:MAG: response regulator [Vallitaleaceae bacterium]|jgi:two-component system response regulator YesN|nr:response regulator [Vallitaleaceae bacterium]
MFKVLIVDDEPYIRKGLGNIINWKSYDCEVCGEASDGVEGIQKIRELKPDIVFVDINMPEINGLEMIRVSKEILPGSKFIILTGYRDFSYLQEAIKLGAYDYILKPSKIEEISDILKRAVFELNMEQAEVAKRNELKEKFEESIPILKEKLLFDLMRGCKISDNELTRYMSLYGLLLKEYLVMFVSIDEIKPEDDEEDQRHLYQFGVSNTVMDFYSDKYRVERVLLNTQIIALIIQPKEDEHIKTDKIAHIAANLGQLILRCFNFTVTMTISSIGYDAHELYGKAEECESCLAYSFYMGPNSIILYKDIKGFYKPSDISGLEKYEKQLSIAIQAGDEVQVKNHLSELNAEIIRYNAEPDQIKHYYWTMVYNINHIRLTIKAMEQSSNDLSYDTRSLYKLIEESHNILEIQELVEAAVMSITKRVNQYNQQNINVILKRAINFIHENYNTTISLQDLADEVFVSTYYLSRMFTKELNKNFVDYLSEVRMEMACTLLNDPFYKTYEVSEKVGISDAHYFSKLFKKYIGMTPTEYRSQKNISEE